MSNDEFTRPPKPDHEPITDENDVRLSEVHYYYTSEALISFARRGRLKRYNELLMHRSKSLLWSPNANNDNATPDPNPEP